MVSTILMGFLRQINNYLMVCASSSDFWNNGSKSEMQYACLGKCVNSAERAPTGNVLKQRCLLKLAFPPHVYNLLSFFFFCRHMFRRVANCIYMYEGSLQLFALF